MRKLIAIAAAVAFAAVPAMATVGIYQDTGAGPGLYDITQVANPGDIIHLTFGFHYPFTTAPHDPIIPVQFQWNFQWDDEEVAVIGMQPAGPFVGANNYSTLSETFFAGFTSTTGDVNLGTFWANPITSTQSTVFTSLTMPVTPDPIGFSDVVPVFQVDLRVLSVNPDTLYDAFVPFGKLLWDTLSEYPCTTGHWGFDMAVVGIGGLSIVPEPASLALLGLGLASMGIAWRRR